MPPAPIRNNHQRKETAMKITVITEDGQTISQHFGRAPYYLVFTLEAGSIVSKEQRDKIGHQQFAQTDHAHQSEHDPRGHGFGTHSESKHGQMISQSRTAKSSSCAGWAWCLPGHGTGQHSPLRDRLGECRGSRQSLRQRHPRQSYRAATLTGVIKILLITCSWGNRPGECRGVLWPPTACQRDLHLLWATRAGSSWLAAYPWNKESRGSLPGSRLLWRLQRVLGSPQP